MFEALTVWKFKDDCVDWVEYVTPFGFEGSDENEIHGILFRFLIVAVGLFFIALFPFPNRLRRFRSKSYLTSPQNSLISRGSSVGSPNALRDSDGFCIKIDEEYEKRRRRRPINVGTIVPVVFSREGSQSSSRNLSISISESGGKDNDCRVDVEFNSLSYAIRSKTGTKDRKYVLRDVTGRCGWGKVISF